jgi:hypothetical protein
MMVINIFMNRFIDHITFIKRFPSIKKFERTVNNQTRSLNENDQELQRGFLLCVEIRIK